jgi:thioredoxin 1
MPLQERQRSSSTLIVNALDVFLCRGSMTERNQTDLILLEDLMADITYVSEGDFDTEVLNSDKPVLVDFTAVWCGPCKMLAPIVEELSGEWRERVKVVKLDVDDNPNLAVNYMVMGVPTLMLFKGGKPAHRMSGYKPKDKVIKEFEPHLN